MNRSFFLVVVLLSALSSLGAQTVPPPATTDFKSDICAVCKMAVTSKSYAAQIVSQGKPLFFDDMGCLVQFERQGSLGPDGIQARYVRSEAGDQWLLAEKAFWVTTKDVRTPMGYGFHAFATQKAADAFVKAHKMARNLPWPEVQTLVPASMGMGGDSMGKM